MKRSFGPSLLFALILAVGAPPALSQAVALRQARPWLGVYLIEPAPGVVEVQEVIEGSPAQKAGLEAGDRVFALDGSPVAGVDAFIQAVQAKAPGHKLALRIQRGDKPMPIEVTLGRDPAAPRPLVYLQAEAPKVELVQPGARPWLGVSIEERPDGLVRVQDVVAGSPAEKAGLRVGDCILALSGDPVASVDALIEKVGVLAPGTKLVLRVLRGQERMNLEVVLGTDPARPMERIRIERGVPERLELPQQPQRPRVIRTLPEAPILRKAPATALPGSLPEALERARAEGKPVLLAFLATWSSPSRLLRAEIKKPDNAKLLGGFVVLPIDVDAHPGLADRFRVDTLPHLEVIAPSGQQVGRILGLHPMPEMARRLEDLRRQAMVPVARPQRMGEGRADPETLDVLREVLEELRQMRKLLEEIRQSVR